MCVITSSLNSIESSYSAPEIMFCSKNRQLCPILAKISSFFSKTDPFSSKSDKKALDDSSSLGNFTHLHNNDFFVKKN